MAKTKRKWLILDYTNPDALTSNHIFHTETDTISTTLNNKVNVDNPIFTASLSIPNGSYSNPAIQFTNDTDTGFYRPGPNQVGISTGGIGRFIINSVKTEILNELHPKQGINLPENQYVKYNNEVISASNLSYNESNTIKERIDKMYEGEFISYNKINSDYTASKYDILLCDSDLYSFTITLPLTASPGDYITIIDTLGTFTTNPVYIGRNAHKINGDALDFELDVANSSTTLIYVDTITGWKTLDAVKCLILTKDTEYKIIDNNYYCKSNEKIILNTNASFTLYLPENPNDGDFLLIKDGFDNASINNITINRNTNKINSADEDLIFDMDSGKLELIYINNTIGWKTYY